MMKNNNNPFRYSIGTIVRHDIIMDMLELCNSDVVLDVGCGLGYFTDMIAGYAPESMGIDIDFKCIAWCRENMKGNYRLVDLTDYPYPFKDNTFDKILCTEVLEHIQDNGAVLDELYRIIKPGGMLVVSVPCKEGMFKSYWKNIGHNYVDGNSREYHHHKGYTAQQLTNMMKYHKFIPGYYEYTMVAGIEIFMGITKILIHRMQLKKIDSQANALNVNGSILWKIYKGLFPLLELYAKAEQKTARRFKGHMIIMKGMPNK